MVKDRLRVASARSALLFAIDNKSIEYFFIFVYGMLFCSFGIRMLVLFNRFCSNCESSVGRFLEGLLPINYYAMTVKV